jgi:hypothetical protein
MKVQSCLADGWLLQGEFGAVDLIVVILIQASSDF